MNGRIKEQCRDLWRNCFHDSENYMDFYFQEKCKDNHILVDKEDNHVVSMVHLNPYRLKWKGQETDSYYIVGVSTEETYRKQGRMRKLLERAFLKMKEEQVPFTYLMPARKEIYEPFGFEPIYSQERLLLKELKIREVLGKQEKELKHMIKTVHKEPELTAAEITDIEKGYSETILEMKHFLELTPEEFDKLVCYANHKLETEFDIYAIRDQAYYVRLQKEMKACLGDVAVFVKQNYEAGRWIGSQIVGIVSYGLENNYMEVTEALIETELTQDMVTLLLQRVKVRDKSQIYFYESYFLEKEQLKAMAEESEMIQKDIIMAKVLEPESSFQEVFGEQKVYLNEIV